MEQSRIVYIVSDGTGITAETLANSLLSQFHGVNFEQRHTPFLTTLDQASALADELNTIASDSGLKPLVFATMTDRAINTTLAGANCHYHDFFEPHLQQLSKDLGLPPTRRSGLSHGLINAQHYDRRIDTVNYTLNHDDAMSMTALDEADVILVGVSRSGKTPTCLYLALHYGVKCANYPLTEDDFERGDLPPSILQQRAKLIAINIDPLRLQEIREKRRPGSRYSSLDNCKQETQKASRIFHRHGLLPLDSTTSSIEEIASRIVKLAGLSRRHYT